MLVYFDRGGFVKLILKVRPQYCLEAVIILTPATETGTEERENENGFVTSNRTTRLRSQIIFTKLSLWHFYT